MKKHMVILGIAILACLGASFWCYQAESMLEKKGYLNYQDVAFDQLEDGLHVGCVVSDVEEGGAGNWIVFLWPAGFCAVGLVMVIVCHVRRGRAGC